MRLVSLFLMMFFCSCNNKSPETVATSNREDVENFEQFDAKFHSDSIFQMSRIKFPLEGYNKDGFNKIDWSAASWEMLKTSVSDTTDIKGFKHKTIITDTTVTEKYWLPDSGFSSERHFKNIDGKWFLVYFHDINL